MWSHAFWSPVGGAAGQLVAFLEATDPTDSQRSSYALWLMDQDGSNAHRVYPPEGENSFFPRDATSLSWSPDGQAMAFIFHDALYILNVVENQVYRVTQDESRNSHPTWVGVESGR
jgi:Tol biopolymer transport system component